MYVCPECEETFELIVSPKVREKYVDAKEVTMTLVHDHSDEVRDAEDEIVVGPVWRAFIREARERKDDTMKEIEAQNREAQKLAREKAVAQKRNSKTHTGFDHGVSEEVRQEKISQYRERWS